MSGNAGWYPDPSGAPGRLRWWDGHRWTQHIVQQFGSTATPASMLPPPTATSAARKWVGGHPVAAGVLLLVGLLCGVAAASTSERGAPAPRDSGVEEVRGVADTTEAPALQSRREPQPTYLVVRVIDGDTVELEDGQAVRLVGIDAPEDGACGHDRATQLLMRLVEGQRVRLRETNEDRDRYDRLLRYVDRGPVDAGLELIESGLAIARYDSRDGYGEHPRETAYVKADRRSPDVTCAASER